MPHTVEDWIEHVEIVLGFKQGDTRIGISDWTKRIYEDFCNGEASFGATSTNAMEAVLIVIQTYDSSKYDLALTGLKKTIELERDKGKSLKKLGEMYNRMRGATLPEKVTKGAGAKKMKENKNYKMSPKEFFRKIIELYFNSREPKFYNPNIFRGRSYSISSELEDLAALFIALNNPNKCNYYTDQPIKFIGSNTKYPDIVIQQEDGTIRDLIDIKTDTGWNRNGMLQFCKEWESQIEAVKGSITEFSKGKTKQKKSGCFSEDLKYHVVVVSQVNSGKQILKDYDLVLNQCANVNLYILSDGMHPNNYGISQEEILNGIKINYPEFERLLGHIVTE